MCTYFVIQKGFSCKIFRSLYLLDLRDFSLKNTQNSLKVKSCLSAASLILFRILSVFQALKNPYSLDFLFLFDQEKRKSIDNQLLIAKKKSAIFLQVIQNSLFDIRYLKNKNYQIQTFKISASI